MHDWKARLGCDAGEGVGRSQSVIVVRDDLGVLEIFANQFESKAGTAHLLGLLGVWSPWGRSPWGQTDFGLLSSGFALFPKTFSRNNLEQTGRVGDTIGTTCIPIATYGKPAGWRL